jgi:hypothetical protein
VKRQFPPPKMINGTIVPDDDKQILNLYYTFVCDDRIDPASRNAAVHLAVDGTEARQRLIQGFFKEHIKVVSVSPTTTAIPTEPPDLGKPPGVIVAATGKARLKIRAKATGHARQEYTPLPEPPTIELPPGYRIAAIASVILTKGAYQRYVAPQIADMQFEYIEAIKAGDERLAQWVRARGYGLIVWALFGSVLNSLITRLVQSAK